MSALAIFSALLYFTSAGLFWRRLNAAGAFPRMLAWASAAGALLLHAWLLESALFKPQGITLSLGHALSLFTWQCALLLALFCLRKPLEHLCIPVFAVAAAGVILGMVLPAGAETVVEQAWTLQLHIALSLLSYGVLTIAAVQAITLSLQDRQLHQHQPTGIARSLPPLQTMEELLFGLITAGFFLLSLALLSGLFFVENLFAQHLVHKTVLSGMAWLFFAVLLWGRWRFGWRGRRAVRWTLGGYGALLLAYFGSKYVLEQLLGTHWN